MNRFVMKYSFAIIAVLLAILIVGCGVQEIGSKWRDREIVIDGTDSGAEWENARNYLDGKKITVGLMNDENTLFIRLSTRDRALQRQLVVQGLTIWFDENADNKKKLGIHFPLGMTALWSMPMRGEDRTARGGEPKEGEPADIARDHAARQVNTLIEAVQKEMEIIGPNKKERKKIDVAEAEKLGIKCRIGMAEGNMVYEMQYPLHRDESNPYGIMRKKSSVIRIGFEAGKMDMSRMRSAMGNGGMGGGRGSGGMGGRGGMGGGMGPGGMGGQQSAQSLEFWVQTRLADKADHASAEASIPQRVKF